MEPKNETDHIAILALMMVGVLIKRLDDLGQLDEATARHLHKLVQSVGGHARKAGLKDLNILFDNVDRALGARAGEMER